MNRAFWEDKRVLVTGHTGFKGSWLTLWLSEMGARVVGYALAPPSEPSLFELADVGGRALSLLGDIRDYDAFRAALAEHRPEIVVHMAAQSLVRPSYADPVATYQTNVMGTVHLFEAVRQVGGVRALVNVTSDKCYENREWPWPYRENDPMGGHDPYSSSKGCAELVTAAFRRSFFSAERHGEHGVGLASARAGNVIGGGDWAEDRLVPDAMRAFAKGEPVEIRNPQAVRPWQHVLDPLAGYLLLAERLYTEGAVFADAWNFGPPAEDSRSVAWVVERCVELWGGEAAWQLSRDAHPHEAHLLKLDCSKARTALDWRPRWGLDEAMQKTVEWYKRVSEGEPARTVCLEHIHDYTESA